jgi:hypothetical protein
MNIKSLIFISILFLITNGSCEKKADLIELCFYETGCANPWSVNHNDPDYQDLVKKYLEEQNIKIKKISISHDGPASGCFSCGCTTGRTINITIDEQDKTLALDLGFFIMQK